MARYIDADKIFYRERMTVFYNSKPIKEYIAFKQDIENVQTEVVAPVIHAHWIENEDCSVVTDIPWSMCAACGSYSPKLLYCAFCGAKMDEEVET